MAVHIGFRLTGSGGRYFTDPGSVALSGVSLRYDLFVGDIEFKVGDCKLDAPWGWVPILDFAAGMTYVVEELKTVGVAVFDFTESEAVIEFREANDGVHVNPSYVSCEGVCSRGELEASVARFARRVLAEVRSAAPGVAKAEAFLNLESQMLERIHDP